MLRWAAVAVRPKRQARALHALAPSLSKLVHDAEASAKKDAALDQPVKADAWVATMRRQKTRTFLELTDGTMGGGATLQAMLTGDAPGIAPGIAVHLQGRMKAGRGKKQSQQVEMHVDAYDILAESELATYPLAHLMHRAESGDAVHAQAADIVRRESHFKARTAHYGALSRTRARMERAMDAWFAKEDFTKMYPPILTSSDCEGGGEIFRVVSDTDVNPSKATTPESLTAFWSGSGAYLSVSAQLHLEAYALGLSRVYCLCPAFRAEGSATNRHLAEFWMMEAELCWVPRGPQGLEMVMQGLEETTKAMVRAAIGLDGSDRQAERAKHDMDLLLNDDSAAVLHKQAGLDTHWPRITYTDAVAKLRAHAAQEPGAFEEEAVWGHSLRSEHERWLAAEAGTPLFVTDYPTGLKPFYMRKNETPVRLTDALAPGCDGKEAVTVACFDLLVPQIGELAGGSLREEREDMLRARIQEHGMDPDASSFAWYTKDLRRYGGAPHGGYGLGMERLLSWVTHIDNVRDIVGFPRVKGPLRY